MQGQHVHGPGPSVAGRLSFASVVTGLDRRIDPGVPQGLGVPNEPGERHDGAESNRLGDGTDPVDYSASPTTEAKGPQDRSSVLVRIASRPWFDKADDDLRPMIPLEEEALAAWVMGGIVRPSPPGFLVCTHPRATRVAMLDFSEDYLEGKVIAVAPPSVRMPQHIAEKTMLLQLL